MTFEVVEHDGSTLNLVLKRGKARVEVLVYKSGEILDVVCGSDPIDGKNEFNLYYALKLLHNSQGSSKDANAKGESRG